MKCELCHQKDAETAIQLEKDGEEQLASDSVDHARIAIHNPRPVDCIRCQKTHPASAATMQEPCFRSATIAQPQR